MWLALSLVLDLAPAAAPSIDHRAVDCMPAGQNTVIEARLNPPARVARGRVYFRARHTPHWYYVELAPAADEGVFAGVLPRPLAATAAVLYYLEVTGPGFESRRTPEQAAGVAAVCENAAPMMTGATVAVGALSGGAPTVPEGFSSAGLVSLTSAAGGGAPMAVVGGGAALAAAAVGVAVWSGGRSDDCPPVTFHEIALDCEGIQRNARVGCELGFQVGVGRWATPAEMQQALAGHRGIIAVDGQELDVTREGATVHAGGGEPPGLGDRARARWKAGAGRHVVTGFWTVYPNAVSRCDVDVRE